jgi:flagellar biosynthesis protein FliQ
MSTGFVMAASREMLVMVLTLVGPFLLAAFLASIVVGLLQASTRINDMTLAFVPRFAAVMLAIYLTASWTLGQLTAYIERSVIAVGAFSG